MASARIALNACEISSPSIIWHGGQDKGKPEPVFSIDLLGDSLIATSGVDDNEPPKGTTRLWSLTADLKPTCFMDFNDHQSVVNIARFSPCGKMLATASDRLIIVYTVPSASQWTELGENRTAPGPGFERTWFANVDLAEIYDLAWAPDSSYIVAGAINSKAQVIPLNKSKDSLSLVGHTSYVQGVAWDPLNKYIVTQSADRSVKFHLLKANNNGLKLANQGHTVVKTMSILESCADRDMADIDVSQAAKPKSLYADSILVKCFFRRLCFTPDGSLLISPTGVLKPSFLKATKVDVNNQAPGIFATHIFHRNDPSAPVLSLAGLDEPSIAIRCCPRLYSSVTHDKANPTEGFPGDYRVVFAVATTSAIFIYDTQHVAAPLMKISNLHLATINDIAWSADGLLLLACSTDGYVSIIRFAEESFGKLIPIADTPLQVKKTYPFIYGYVPEAPAPAAPVEGSPSAVADVESAAKADDVSLKEVITPMPMKSFEGEESAKETAVVEGAVHEASVSLAPPLKKKRITPQTVFVDAPPSLTASL